MQGLQIFLLLRRQRSNGFCGDCFCGFCGSYPKLGLHMTSTHACQLRRSAPKCQSVVDKQVDKKSLWGNSSWLAFSVWVLVSISIMKPTGRYGNELWFGVLQRGVLTPDTSSIVPGIGNSLMTHLHPSLISPLCSNESPK